MIYLEHVKTDSIKFHNIEKLRVVKESFPAGESHDKFCLTDIYITVDGEETRIALFTSKELDLTEDYNADSP